MKSFKYVLLSFILSAALVGCGSDPEYCGNGVVGPAEACDDGNTVGGDGCSSDCQSTEICGNGIIDVAAGEICDDGNTAGGDGCAANCIREECGNGALETGEVCDDGNHTDGDGCASNCQSTETCGNGIVDVAAGEGCDDGNNVDGDGCQAGCMLPGCGDGILDGAEACDDGNNIDGDGCNATCTSSESCGNGILDMGEGCDDGNNTDGDGCQASCALPGCGDGIVDGVEVCDDGNNTGGDGCSATCTSTESCGNGILDGGEECDDGNSVGGDGCAANCTYECPAGLSECTGECVDTQYDPDNCGGCGISCPAGQACVPGGACVALAEIFPLPSYDPTLSFAYHPQLETIGVSIAWDGTSYWTASGGTNTGVRLAQHDPAGAALGAFSPGIDFRSVFTKGNGTAPVFARGFDNPQIFVQSAAGTFGNDIVLTGGALDFQSTVVWDASRNEFVAFNMGTISRWDAAGAFVGTVTLVGYGVGSEGTFPQNRGAAVLGDHYLTYADGVLSAWSIQGERVDTTVLNSAGTNFDAHLTLSVANTMVWIGDGATWRGYQMTL